MTDWRLEPHPLFNARNDKNSADFTGPGGTNSALPGIAGPGHPGPGSPGPGRPGLAKFNSSINQNMVGHSAAGSGNPFSHPNPVFTQPNPLLTPKRDPWK